MEIKPFYLLRHKDISGTSGIGIVGIGAIFPSGKAIFEWCSYQKSLIQFENIEHVIEVHGHEGRTEVIMGHPPKKRGRKKNGTTNN